MAIVDINPAVQNLLPLLRQFVKGDYAIALGGAHAKGIADTESDVDLYLFSEQILSSVERECLTKLWSTDVHNVVCWDVGEPFVQAGTDFYLGDFRVECWLRNSSAISKTVDECLEGNYAQELVTWTPTGFFSHCCLSDLRSMIPLDDPAGIIDEWKEKVDLYPRKLKEAIVSRHLNAARFWPHNFHYTSAVNRCDVIYTSGIVQQVIHNLIQVVFAVNGVYFPGDKKLAKEISKLELKPERFEERIERLLVPSGTACDELLRHQQHELQTLLSEVDMLLNH